MTRKNNDNDNNNGSRGIDGWEEVDPNDEYLGPKGVSRHLNKEIQNLQYIIAEAKKKLLENVTETIGTLWRASPTPSPHEIMEVWNPNMQRVFADIREKQFGNPESDIEQYISQAYRRLQGIAGVLHDNMSKDPPPTRILSEVTITNPATRHEGRVDAIFQYPEYVETVEWKTMLMEELQLMIAIRQ